MNLDKIKSLIDQVSNKLGNNDSSEKTSATQGIKEKIYGVNKKAVILISVVIGGLLIAAFSSQSFQSSAPQVQNQKQKVEKGNSEANLDGENRDETVNSYEQIANSTRDNSLNARRMQEEQAANMQHGDMHNDPYGHGEPAPLPPVPNDNYYGNAPQMGQVPPAPQQVVQQAPQKTAEQIREEKRKKYSTPISFGVKSANNLKAPAANGAVANNNGEATGANGENKTMTPSVGAFNRLSYNTIQTGTFIPAVLINGINTDLAGQITAQISSNVYDTLTGATVLIPAGSRIIGEYQQGAGDGRRVAVQWKSLILPNGGSYSLNNVFSATDGSGYTGILGKRSSHSVKMWKAGLLTSAFAALGNMTAGNTSSDDKNLSAGQLAMQGATANMLNVASDIFNKGANINPTITVPAGTQFYLYVNSNITLNPYNQLNNMMYNK